MKGGFQILDLSGLTVGTEAAVRDAFKTAEGFNNKAILVLPPAGGSVYCQLNKSSDNYVGAYVGADGATYNIVIKPNNNVTVTKTEAVTEAELTPITASIMSIGGQVENLQTDVTKLKANTFGDETEITLSSVTGGKSKSITLEEDAYLTYECHFAKLNSIVFNAHISGLSVLRREVTSIDENELISVSIFVKAGTYLVGYATNNDQYAWAKIYKTELS